ncbi:MAG: tetratricopeptide repeat protein [Gammaproteobacteria bacterium]|nr:tetratricopeptide repeat protein [Gammaproteobacteria bacterium]
MAGKQVMRKIIFFCVLIALTGCQSTGMTVKEGTVEETSLMKVRMDALNSYQQRDYRAALPLYEHLTTEVTSDPELWFHLGNIYARLQRPNQAISAYHSTLKLNSKNAKAWHNLGIVQLRQSANTFTQMLINVPPNDPLYQRGETVSHELLRILGNTLNTSPPQEPAEK